MLAQGTILQGRYLILRHLGRGGMGAVYGAEDRRLGHRVAIKETLVETDELRLAFEREARLLARLRHPALPKVTDHFIEGGGQYLVMEYVPGEDLAKLLGSRRSPFPPDEVVEWARQLLDALSYLHAQEPPVIHRDIKRANLKLMADGGRIILLDFGLAKGLIETTLQAGEGLSVRGYTPHYASLEQIQGEGTDARSDIYSLAATLYHLATNVQPPDALARATALVNRQPDPLLPASTVNPLVPDSVSAALARAMSLNRDERPRTAGAFSGLLNTGALPEEATTVVDETETVVSARGESSETAATEIATRTRARALPDEVEAVTALRPPRRDRPAGIIAGVALLALAALIAGIYVATAYRSGSGTAHVNANKIAPSITPSPTAVSTPSVTPELLSAAARAARARLSDRGVSYTPESFLERVNGGDVNTVGLFLDAGMDPNTTGGGDQTPIMIAAAQGHNHIASMLLEEGASVNTADHYGNTPLIYAAINGNRETLDVLLRGGAEVNATNEKGESALLQAAKNGHREIARTLIDAGAQVNARDRSGRSPRNWAEINSHPDIVKLLDAAGATLR